MSETVECPYCGQVFEGETEIEAENKEGIHRSETHIIQDQEIERNADLTGFSIVDDWKRKTGAIKE